MNDADYFQRTKRMSQGSRKNKRLTYNKKKILKEPKTRREKVTMAWINYKKTYDIVRQMWIIVFKMYKILLHTEKRNKNAYV